MIKPLNKVHISWEEFENAIRDVYIEPNKYNGIIAVLRGGFYIADAICRKYNLPLYYFNCKSYKGQTQSSIEVVDWDEIASGHYLIVDDIYATGKTVECVKEYYDHCTFDVYCLVSNQVIDDIQYRYFIRPNNWVVFPWEKFDKE